MLHNISPLRSLSVTRVTHRWAGGIASCLSQIGKHPVTFVTLTERFFLACPLPPRHDGLGVSLPALGGRLMSFLSQPGTKASAL